MLGPGTLRLALVAAALAALPPLAGCAAGGARPDALEIVEWQHVERQKLQAQGFEQYSGE